MSSPLPDALALAAANDPTTPPQLLADIAYHYPQLRATVARNPAAYEELRRWIELFPASAPAGRAAVAAAPRIRVPDPDAGRRRLAALLALVGLAVPYAFEVLQNEWVGWAEKWKYDEAPQVVAFLVPFLAAAAIVPTRTWLRRLIGIVLLCAGLGVEVLQLYLNRLIDPAYYTLAAQERVEAMLRHHSSVEFYYRHQSAAGTTFWCAYFALLVAAWCVLREASVVSTAVAIISGSAVMFVWIWFGWRLVDDLGTLSSAIADYLIEGAIWVGAASLAKPLASRLPRDPWPLTGDAAQRGGIHV